MAFGIVAGILTEERIHQNGPNYNNNDEVDEQSRWQASQMNAEKKRREHHVKKYVNINLETLLNISSEWHLYICRATKIKI